MSHFEKLASLATMQNETLKCVNLVIFCEGSQVWILTLLHNPIKGLKEAFFLPRAGTRVHGTSQQTSKEFVDTFLVPWLSLESSRGYSQGDNRIVSVTRKYIAHCTLLNSLDLPAGFWRRKINELQWNQKADNHKIRQSLLMFISLTCEFSLNYSQILVQLLNFKSNLKSRTERK